MSRGARRDVAQHGGSEIATATRPPSSGGHAQPQIAPLLGLTNIAKRFGEVTAIDGVSLDIRPGEFVTLVGPSGCGKSTLFNIVAGLLEPDPGGEIRLNGATSELAALLGQVSFMPQRDLLFPWRTVLDNAILPIEIEGEPRANSRARRRADVPRVRAKGFEDHTRTSSRVACASASR